MNRKKASLLNILLLSVLFIVCIVHCCYDVVNKKRKSVFLACCCYPFCSNQQHTNFIINSNHQQ